MEVTLDSSPLEVPEIASEKSNPQIPQMTSLSWLYLMDGRRVVNQNHETGVNIKLI